MLVAAFKHVGVSDQDIDWLMPRIIDYIDPDQAMMLNGAERYDYMRRDLAPPANWFMATPLELKKVLGVDDLLAPQQMARLAAHCHGPLEDQLQRQHHAARRLGGAAWRRCRCRARDIGPARRAAGGERYKAVVATTGRTVPLGEDALMLPSRIFRLAVWRPGDGVCALVGITLTPGSTFGPWRKEYSYSEPVDDRAAHAIEAATPLFQST